jgi:NADH dehydrogenase
MRWILIEAGPRVLNEIDKGLADYTVNELRRRGIDIRLNTMIEEVGADFVTISTGERLETRTLVWTAGVTPNPIVKELGLPLTDGGRIAVDATTQVIGVDDVWAIGDAAAVPNPQNRERPTPPTAQHATRQGCIAGHNVAASLGKGVTKPYAYKDRGTFVNLGRYKAVAMAGRVKLRGPLAWWMARTYHVSQIPGTRRKIRALVDWTVSLPFSRDVAEVGSIGHPRRLEGSADSPPVKVPEADAGGVPRNVRPPAER